MGSVKYQQSVARKFQNGTLDYPVDTVRERTYNLFVDRKTTDLRRKKFMIVAKNDEAKRSRLWRTALLVSSVLIVLISANEIIYDESAGRQMGGREWEDQSEC